MYFSTESLHSKHHVPCRDYLAKIADVGIARVLTETHMNSLTSTGTFAWVRLATLVQHCPCDVQHLWPLQLAWPCCETAEGQALQVLPACCAMHTGPHFHSPYSCMQQHDIRAYSCSCMTYNQLLCPWLQPQQEHGCAACWQDLYTASHTYSQPVRHSAQSCPQAAPELLMGDRITEQADIYSYGVVLWVRTCGL